MMMMLVVMVGMFVTMPMIAAAEQEHGDDVHDQTQNGDRNSLVETDRHRSDEARESFIADKKRDHGEHDGAGETGQIAKLAGAEAETLVIYVAARIAVGERSKEQRAYMRRHVQAVGDERDRAEQNAAGDFGDHHEAAQRDHQPGAPLVRSTLLSGRHRQDRPEMAGA